MLSFSILPRHSTKCLTVACYTSFTTMAFKIPLFAGSNHLSQRKQSVLLDGTKSTEANVLSCVLQGTFLGPHLLLTFINDLLKSTKHSDDRLFADDWLLYRHGTSSQDQALLQEDLSALERWEETWQMKFPPLADKYTVIRITTNRKQILKTNYQIHGHT